MKKSQMDKFFGLLMIVVMLVAPVTEAFTSVTLARNVNAEGNWGYDSDNPQLSEYDQLLQNAGPSDGAVDWYPAERFASSSNIRASQLVKQLIDLSIVTNSENSNARHVLFNGTTGNNPKAGYKETYNKYRLAFGFIAQILAFNNEKVGDGAYLHQGFESSADGKKGSFVPEEDVFVATGKYPDRDILEIPKIGEGRNVSDILGTALFGDPDKAYAQIYVNGYDNVSQNESNIIRETTTSITLVAQSSLVGRKATAIFKLNNKTFNNLAPEVLLENGIDNSPSFGGKWGTENISRNETKQLGDSMAGVFNQRSNLKTGLTDNQKSLINVGGSTAWVDPKTGSGTIVVPRGTDASTIAKKIKQLGYKNNYNISNVAPMKAIHGDKYNGGTSQSGAENSYNVKGTFNGSNFGVDLDLNTTLLSNNLFEFNEDQRVRDAKKKDNYFALADPRIKVNANHTEVADSVSKLTDNFANSLLYNPLNTSKTGPTGLNSGYDNKIAAKLPNQAAEGANTAGISNLGASGTSSNQVFEPPLSGQWPSYVYRGVSSGSPSVISASFNNDQASPSGINGRFSTYPFGGPRKHPTVSGRAVFGGGNLVFDNNQMQVRNSSDAADKLGDVVHAFEPGDVSKEIYQNSNSPFKVREAWDSTHAIFGTSPFSSLSEEQIRERIAKNGSFNNISGDKIKKSFTFNMPLNNTVMKSYRNPYSTVISSALPFGKTQDGDPIDFKANTDYHQINGDMNSDGFTGDYLKLSAPSENPWYENKSTGTYEVVWDESNRPLHFGTGREASSHNSLHVNYSTWGWARDNNSFKPSNPNGVSGSEKGFYNLTNENQIEKNFYRNWLNTDGSIFSSTRLYGKKFHLSSRTDNEKVNSFPVVKWHDPTISGSKTQVLNQSKVIDANNSNYFKDPKAVSRGDWLDQNHKPTLNGENDPTSNSTTREWQHVDSSAPGSMEINANNYIDETTLPEQEGSSAKINVSYDSYYHTVEKHLQLMKNSGYILINAAGLDESTATELKKYQVPSGPSGHNILDGIKNGADLIRGGFLKAYPVDDDPNYRGGLLGVMSIVGKGQVHGLGINGTDNILKQQKAESIYGQLVYRAGSHLQVPTMSGITDKAGYRVETGFPALRDLSNNGEFASDTDLHYGLAWNDSSDLPQVKIRRSLNVQYLIPVSIVRTVTTDWYQFNKNGRQDTDSRGNWKNDYSQKPSYFRYINTEYDNYEMYAGNVKLNSVPDGSSSPDYTTALNTGSIENKDKYNSIYLKDASDEINEILPVNNQISYTRIDQSYPHYDSELYDQGSNIKDITATRGGTKGFVGTSTEKETTSDTIGSSDDYSIGIVEAPSKFFFGTDGSRPFEEKPGVSDSTENRAGSNEGINRKLDTPENSNGMPIGKKESYATLAEAYNVEIENDGKDAKVRAKEDDDSNNKDQRVALVEQLMANGGKAKAYYYIPSLPRIYNTGNKARINVVIYDKAAVSKPNKKDTKPSFSTTDISQDNAKLRPYTTTYDDGAVLKEADVPQSFKNSLANILVAGNPDFVNDTDKLRQTLISAFLGSWQQSDSTIKAPFYLFGGFGISNSDTKNSYSQWPTGYASPNDISTEYHQAINFFVGDFYRGGIELKDGLGNILPNSKVPSTALTADVSKVDLTKAGSYPVVFTYTNPSNDQDRASITVPIKITDASNPVFAFKGSNHVTIKAGESFDQNAFKVVGSWAIFNKYNGNYDQLENYEGIARNSDGDPDVTVSGNLDTATPGIYQLTYKATNLNGTTTSMNRTITVLSKESPTNDWTIADYHGIGYINYVPNYGINVWSEPAGAFVGQRLQHATAWKVFKRAVNAKGQTFYNVGKNQWIDGKYVSFSPVGTMEKLDGIVTINYVPNYGVNLWKNPSTTGGFYEGRKLADGTKWKTFGKQNGFFKVGNNQWIQGEYAIYKAN